MKIKRQALSDASSSCMTWQNFRAPSSIGRMGLNDDVSHLSISFEQLIEDEEANQTVKPKCNLFIPLLFDKKGILRCFK